MQQKKGPLHTFRFPILKTTLVESVGLGVGILLVVTLMLVMNSALKKNFTYGTRASEPRTMDDSLRDILSPSPADAVVPLRSVVSASPVISASPSSTMTGPHLAFGRRSDTQENMLYVLASSDGENVDGYDVLISYDSSEVEIIAVESLVEQFEVLEFMHDTFISVTGYKQLTVQPAEEITIFADTPLFSLSYQPLGVGGDSPTFTFLARKGPESTKFALPDARAMVTTITPQFDPTMRVFTVEDLDE